MFEQVPDEGHGFGSVPDLPVRLALLEGDVDRAQRLVDELPIGRSETDNLQDRMTFAFLLSDHHECLRRPSRALEMVTPWPMSRSSSMWKPIFEEALTAAAGLGRDARSAIIERMDAILPASTPPSTALPVAAVPRSSRRRAGRPVPRCRERFPVSTG